MEVGCFSGCDRTALDALCGSHESTGRTRSRAVSSGSRQGGIGETGLQSGDLPFRHGHQRRARQRGRLLRPCNCLRSEGAARPGCCGHEQSHRAQTFGSERVLCSRRDLCLQGALQRSHRGLRRVAPAGSLQCVDPIRAGRGLSERRGLPSGHGGFQSGSDSQSQPPGGVLREGDDVSQDGQDRSGHRGAQPRDRARPQLCRSLLQPRRLLLPDQRLQSVLG